MPPSPPPLALVLFFLAACGHPEPTPETKASAVDASEILVRPAPASADQRPTNASRGAPARTASSAPTRQPRFGACADDGSLAKGTVRTSGIDLHSYARVLGETFKKDVVVAGDLAAPKGKAPCVEWCLAPPQMSLAASSR